MPPFAPAAITFGDLFRPARLGAFLRARPDSEHELSFNRLFMVTVIIGYLVVAGRLGSATAAAALGIVWLHILVFTLVSIALFADVILRPDSSPARRLIGIVSDIGIFSYGLHACGEAGAALFPIYLWVIIGNGFRFGRRYLAFAAITAVVCFTTMAVSTPFWRANPIFGVGILFGLIGIPAYVSGLIGKLYEAKHQAEEANRAKSLFLASVSHELRTPLNAVIGLSDLLSRSTLTSEQRHMSRVIGQSGATLLGLINSLLDFARIEAGRVDVRSETVDLARFLRDMRELIGVSAFAKGVRVALHVTRRTPRLIATDRRHLEEIFTNLAGNAAKFTSAGHVGIRVDAVPIGSAYRLRVDISDTGIGISPEAQTQIFESFTQADATIIDRFGGTGLGLAIVRQLVHLHGGEIRVASTVGFGSTFSFDIAVGAVSDEVAPPADGFPVVVALTPAADRFDGFPPPILCDDVSQARAAVDDLRRRGQRRPIVVVDATTWHDRLEEIGSTLLGEGPADEPCLMLLSNGTWVERLDPALDNLYTTAILRGAAEPLAFVAEIAQTSRDTAETSHETAASLPAHGLSILVAEDNKTNQMVIGKILERAGHRVTIVENGEDAVDRMLADDFDLVLMDINMPVLNGIEATRHYRFAALGRPRVPILGLTADATADAEQRCRDAGMDGCMTKPVEPDRLVATVEAMGLRRSPVAVRATPAVAEQTTSETADAASTTSEIAPIIDMAKLADLESLGGREFVDELVAQFVGEATTILSSLAAAVATEDLHTFHDRIHALRSGAANVGATRVYQMCLDWRRIDARELALQGEFRLRALSEEFDRVREAIDHRAP